MKKSQIFLGPKIDMLTGMCIIVKMCQKVMGTVIWDRLYSCVCI